MWRRIWFIPLGQITYGSDFFLFASYYLHLRYDESLLRCLMLGLRTLLRRIRLSAHPCAAVRHAVGLYKILTKTNATLSQASIISGTTLSDYL